jgi:uncharacterized protein
MVPVSMRILAFTDVHGDERALQELAKKASKADLLLCAGDLSVFGMELYEVLERINSWGKPVYFVHGNHEDEEIFAEVHSTFPNLHYIHGKEVEHKDIFILGWGGGGFAKEDPKLAKFIAKYKPRANRVLIFHGPPHGTKLDYKDGYNYTGCKTRRSAIENLQPFLVLAGHIHENFEQQDKIGKSLLLNPGPAGKFIDANVKK